MTQAAMARPQSIQQVADAEMAVARFVIQTMLHST